jgi:hypothetical protein
MVRANRTLSTLCAKILRADTRCRRRRWQWLVTDCALLTGSVETRRPVGNNLFISRHTRVPRVTCTSCGAYTNVRTYSPYARASQPCVYVHACTQVHFSRLYMRARTPCTRRFFVLVHLRNVVHARYAYSLTYRTRARTRAPPTAQTSNNPISQVVRST